jgi:hypothetical protein
VTIGSPGATVATMRLALLFTLAVLAACSANDDVPSPALSGVQPNPAPSGAVVTLTGDHFCPRPATAPPGDDDNAVCDAPGDVHFGAAPGTPTTWTDTSIAVEVPDGIAGDVDLTVIVGGRPSNAITFTAD